MKSQREYILSSASCPCCDSGNVEGQSVDIDGGGASQEVFCHNCRFSWTDNYKLIGFQYERDDLPEIVHSPEPAPLAEQLTRHLSEEERKARR